MYKVVISMNKKGIALIMVVGVLALLAIIATSFALNMRLEYHAAMNCYNGVRARYFAEAALERAVAGLRALAMSDAFNDLAQPWARNDHAADLNSEYNNKQQIDADNLSGRINSNGTSAATEIYDEQRKVNINTANALLLSNLVSRVFPGWTNSTVNTFAGKITGHIPCNNLNELIINVPSGSNNHINKANLDTLRPFITVNSYRDPNCGNRAPVNINTCSQEVMESIFAGLRGSSGPAINDARAANAASAVIAAQPITSWSSFDNVIDAVGGLNANQRAAIKDNCNPNRTKPTSSTTEFCFNSGGCYTIIAVGTVTGALGVPAGSNTLRAVVKIYDIYCETTKAQFKMGNEDKNYNNILDAGEDTNGNGVLDVPVRVTWLNSCPVDSTDLFGSYSIPASAETIDDSLKLGFWDNFDEDFLTYSTNEWIAASGTRIFIDADSSDSDLEMTDQGLWTWGKYDLKSAVKWTWSNFNMRVFCYDTQVCPQMKEVGQILFRGGIPAALHARNGVLEWGGLYAYENPHGSGNVDFWTDAQAISNGYNPSTDRYSYPSQITIWKGFYSDPCDDQDAYRTLLAYNARKTHNILANGSSVSDTVYTSGNHKTFSTIGVSTATGITSLYGQRLKVAWDDIRIISPDGNFTSQVINSTLSPGMTGNVSWGTITGTVTIPSTASAASEKVTFQTMSNADGATWKNANPVAGGIIGSIAGSGIQYKALLTTANSQIKETPVLEDITITYLPKVKIMSYSLSQ